MLSQDCLQLGRPDIVSFAGEGINVSSGQIFQKMMKTYLFVLLFLSVAGSEVFGQLYAGLGYSYASPTKSSLDDFSGYAITIQKDFREGKRIEALVSLSGSVMTDDFDKGPSILGATSNNLSLAALARKRLKINSSWSVSVFAGPFASWLWYFRPETIVLDDIFINAGRFGLETGIMSTVKLSDKFTMRLIPLHLQFDQADFRHGIMSVLITWE